nr:rRNA maturation RNase YbeY [Scopulibacillus daqui]
MYDETGELKKEDQHLIIDLLEHAAGRLKIEEEAELSVTFVDNKRIQEINAEYRHKDQPTDVISFALEEQGENEVNIIDEGTAPRVLGDIIVSLPKAHEQAEYYGHSFQRELGFLVVHGFLHLLGYDHMTEEDEKEMFSLQDDILESYGLSRFS